MVKFFNYSGNKIKSSPLINKYIHNSNSDTYVEPFVGSGGILFNLDKEFKNYVINDIDRNIVRMYETFKVIQYSEYLDAIEFVRTEFGFYGPNSRNMPEERKSLYKSSYYLFRDWFNETMWNTNSVQEGIYLHILANSCLNYFLRFGPNGMNQSFGDRMYTINQSNFNSVKSILQRTTILNTSYIDVVESYPNALFFLDPPYLSQASSYTGFNEDDLKQFIEVIKGKEYIYTDIKNEYNEHLNGEFIRDIVSTSPANSGVSRDNHEYVFSTLKKYSPMDDLW
jgi:site-specific DNA-adenine methylase